MTISTDSQTSAASEAERRREAQVRQAEELLFSETKLSSPARDLFHGNFSTGLLSTYPRLTGREAEQVDDALLQLRNFCDSHLDPDAIDRNAEIPREVIDGLGQLGVLGMTAPVALGGRGFSQLAYCRVLEELGARCSSTSIFVNAHHSIGMRSLLLFGTDEQKRRWLPGLVTGGKLAAFALTEQNAGSDAANVQTTAEPTSDGHFILNGEKRYITNGAIADVLTVMARTPNPSGNGPDSGITAFLVTPDMPGFQVVEPRMEKLGIRGTATAKLAFRDMRVPAANVLGPRGKGLKVALTVLDFGRTTFGACCTGAAKTCLKLATAHARNRIQFGQPLGDFELVQHKLARMAAWTYAMEAMTTIVAGLVDRGTNSEAIDYMLETAMLKVWSTERLWTIVNDVFQIYGGAAYFTDCPLERMLRDARINQIGEGANEVLTSFIALVGMREPGEQLRSVWQALHRPLSGLGTLSRFTGHEIARRFDWPSVPVQSPTLTPCARQLSDLIHRFGLAVEHALIEHREPILERQLVQARIADAAMELFASACALSRRDAELSDNAADDAGRSRNGNGASASSQDPSGSDDWHASASTLFLKLSARRVQRSLNDLRNNDDSAIRETAKRVLNGVE